MWQETLENDLHGVAAKAARSSSQPLYVQRFEPAKIKPINGNTANVGLVVLMLLLVVFLVGAWYYKTQIANNPVASNQYSHLHRSPLNQYPERYYPDYRQPERRDVPSEHDLQQQAMRKLWERNKWTADRLTLMAMLHNHNTAVARNSYPKQDFMYLNPDWTIDRMPKHLDLDSDDTAFLRQFLRSKEL